MEGALRVHLFTPTLFGPELSLMTTLVFLIRVLLFSHETASCVEIFKLVRPSEGYFQCFYLLGRYLPYCETGTYFRRAFTSRMHSVSLGQKQLIYFGYLYPSTVPYVLQLLSY